MRSCGSSRPESEPKGRERAKRMTKDEREALLREMLGSLEPLVRRAERKFAKMPAGPDRDAAAKDIAEIHKIMERLRTEFGTEEPAAKRNATRKAVTPATNTRKRAPVVRSCNGCGLTTTLTTCVDCEWRKISYAALGGLGRIKPRIERAKTAIDRSRLSAQEKAAALAVFYGDAAALARSVVFLLSRNRQGAVSEPHNLPLLRDAARVLERLQQYFSRERLTVVSVKKTARRRRRKGAK